MHLPANSMEHRVSWARVVFVALSMGAILVVVSLILRESGSVGNCVLDGK